MNSISIRPSMKERLQFISIQALTAIFHLLSKRYYTFLWSFEVVPPQFLAWASRIRAKRAARRAVLFVPAYSKFVKKNEGAMAETDKASYINAYSIDERCRGGKMPTTGVVIDESSGSSGTPYNWVRSPEERSDSHQFISYFTRYCFGPSPGIIINAFSMGAWATGLNMGIALQRNSIVKNTGPDIRKIFNTLSYFGEKQAYLILGYPPFIKQIIDVALAESFPLKNFTLNAIVGGEGMSEGLRDYLLPYFQNVYSGYGATDMEIGMAGETPLTVAIRRLTRSNPSLRAKLFGADSRLPMLFQYNPLMHFLEVNEKDEILCTISRDNILSPRIRYNVHDQGGIMDFDKMMRILSDSGLDVSALTGSPKPLHLPFLWIYGRRDYTLSIMGANIYPEDIEQCLYSSPELSRITRSYCQSLVDAADAGVRPLFCFEISEVPTEERVLAFSETITTNLIRINSDFRTAWYENRNALLPVVKLFGFNEGPFKTSQGQIKQVRVVNVDRNRS